MKYLFLLLLISLQVLAEKPNVVFILADDLGSGDVQSYNPEGKIPTPGIDKLAKEGMRFTDAHSASAVCTPTRYGLLTGRYSWRSRLQSGVMVTGQPKLILPDIMTVPQFLKNNSYKTAIVGKWHLGFKYEMPQGQKMRSIKTELPWEPTTVMAAPVGSKVIDGPTHFGFDKFSGFHHAREMHSWVEQDEVTEHVELEKVLGKITDRSISWIEERVKAADGPFFLYVAFGSPHTPIAPSKDWQGKSGISGYGDFVMETDNSVQKIVQTIDKLGIGKNTLVIFSADNGCSPEANFKDLLSKKHNPSYIYRGHKADGWEGGHRVPYVVRWPGKVAENSKSDELICLNSLFATLANILEVPIPENAAPDSFSILPVLKGEKLDSPTHPLVIHHSINGSFSIRQGKWKYLAHANSGGWSKGGDNEPVQLYDMEKDPSETKNLAKEHAEIVAELHKLLEKSINDGRTTPGNPLKNEVPVKIFKK